MKPQSLEFLLHSNIEPHDVSCSYFRFLHGSITDYSTVGRKRNIIHLILRGKREYLFEGRRQVFDEHTVLFIPEGTNYVTVSRESDGGSAGISLLFSLDEEIMKEIPCGIYPTKTYAKSDFEKTFFDLCDLCATMPTKLLRRKILALSVLCAFVTKLTAHDQNARLIEPALAYIAEHYRENLAVSAYAAVCNLSESYFRRKFFEIMGLSPIEYRNHLRFSEARRLYQNGVTVKALAEAVGFCDENYLSKLYKKHFGRSLKDDVRFL